VNARIRGLVVVMMLATVLSSTVSADDPIDLDLWHEELIETLGEEPEPAADRRPALGIFPTLGVALGPPNWAAAQGHAYLSFTDGKSFSIYAGYGLEWGPRADASVITLGWGGVRPIPVATKQIGFHGKFLRYRRWDDEDHGVHHGLSVGAESGISFGAIAFEVGAARSNQNHWLVVGQIALKFAAPIRIPLTKRAPPPPDTDS
jgi:hypothetical protein